MAAAAQLAGEHEPGAQPGPDRDEREVVDAPAEAAPVLAQRREVDVVLDRHRQPEAPLELGADGRALEAGPFSASRTRPVRASTTPGMPITTESMRSAGRPLRRRPVAHPRRRPRGRVRASARSSSMSWRARIVPREVRQRAAQEPRADVDAEDERGLGDGLEEHGPVAGPARASSASRTSPACSSDCSATETVGFEIRARREISAREIGAPSRIASRTARSLRSLRSARAGRRSGARSHHRKEH